MLDEVKSELRDDNKLYSQAEAMQRKISFRNNFKDPINYRYQKKRASREEATEEVPLEFYQTQSSIQKDELENNKN